MRPTFDELVAEAAVAPIEGWDFSWLDGRATEERAPWGYSRLVAERMTTASRAVDLQSGGGELLAGLAATAPVTVATEGWAPNLAVAGRRLLPLGLWVVGVQDDGPHLPFRGEVFDLVTSRHPVQTWWTEIARILEPGGTFLSQQVGAGTVRELVEAIRGPVAPSDRRNPQRAVEEASRAGLEVLDLREARLPTVFHDVGAVVYFLRLVVWLVPDFTVDRYRPALAALHDRIEADGSFVTYARRFLIEARKP